MALNATPKSPSANSYNTEAETTQILTEEWLNTSAWVAALTPAHEASLIMSTALMDFCFIYDGSPRELLQALRLPRAGLVDADGRTLDMETIPKLAKKACAVLANSLLASNRVAEPALLGLGIASASLGPISVTLDAKQVKALIPHEVVILLEPIAHLNPIASTGSCVVKLQRK